MSEKTSLQAAGDTARPSEIRVWDPFVRIFHWSLVTLFAVAYISEGRPQWLHTWAGYIIATLLVLRILWGLVGPRHARFTDFIYRPSTVLAYARDLVRLKSRRYIGHSPGGGAVIVMIILSVSMTAITGMATLALDKGKGPLAPWLAPAAAAQTTVPAPSFALVTAAHAEEEHNFEGGRRYRGWVKDVHEFMANLSVWLVAFHFAGVMFVSFAHRENLARSMITGRKRAEEDPG